MTTAELIKILCKQQNISIAELARRIGQSRQNLYKKMQRDTLTIDEIKQIRGHNVQTQNREDEPMTKEKTKVYLYTRVSTAMQMILL